MLWLAGAGAQGRAPAVVRAAVGNQLAFTVARGRRPLPQAPQRGGPEEGVREGPGGRRSAAAPAPPATTPAAATTTTKPAAAAAGAAVR